MADKIRIKLRIGSEDMKKSFVIMDNWAVTLKNLDDQTAGALIKLICRYQIDGSEECDNFIAQAIFKGWKDQIIANNSTYEAKVERARNARSKKNSDIKHDINSKKDVLKDDIKADINSDINGVTDTDTVSTTVDTKYIVGQTRRKRQQSDTDYGAEIKEIVDYLNDKTSSHFKPTTAETRKSIIARLKENYTVENFKTVIDTKVRDWGDDERMRDYLRPQTLFRPSNFESYLNSAQRSRSPTKPNKKNGFNDFPQNSYDFAELEKQLIKN